ncbi:uracil-DNA glycosylase family protein [Alysiella filiformis]|uniref:DNA polymerase n=1 Tax=Alysiella filiformis DSM 16848 TaxID=1120981 RepID=A0A286E6V2_9NEIS|nr:uracil-DNA glycosylase family protein [Alysiella filiformis]QMT31534.1 hypothetical protein H3L97_01085 [Alysiella filiformis]UBQ55452.1 hypothetical protein JF568_07590 [Alysiella filiformis DSM 16848]SOD66632.1 DNA polymerase [Alysiella filiformis DSM 16848]
MLNSRYIHLHEALGLGAMWLKNSAKIIAQPTPNTFRQPEKKHKTPNPQARQQLIAFLQKTESTPTPIAKPIQATQPTTHFQISLHPARLFVLSACPTWQDISANRLFSGEDGALLQKMFAAIQLPIAQVQYSCWIKNLPPQHISPTPEMFAAALNEIQHEKNTVQAQAILLLGDDFQRPNMQALITQMAGDTPVFIISHPLRIQRDSTLRRPAWETLQRLQAHLAHNA